MLLASSLQKKPLVAYAPLDQLFELITSLPCQESFFKLSKELLGQSLKRASDDELEAAANDFALSLAAVMAEQHLRKAIDLKAVKMQLVR
jgi:hypothetical protein